MFPHSSAPTRRALTLVLASLALLPSCSEQKIDAAQIAESTGARPRQTPKVRTEPAVRREMVEYLELSTDLESETEVQLRPERPGTVVAILAEEGDRVSAGQALARLDRRREELALREAEVALQESKQALETAKLAVEEAKNQLATAKLSAEQTERDYKRNVQLYEGTEKKPSALSVQALEASRLERDRASAEAARLELSQRRTELDARNAETAVARADLALERAREDHLEMELRAPFDGVIANRMLRVGQNVTSADMAYTLTDPQKLRAIFFRPQRELALFSGSEGANGTLTVTAEAEALPGQSFDGYIERVAPTIDPTSGNFRVTARIAASADGGESPALRAGMLLRLKIATRRHANALVVPKRALRREGEEAFLFAVRDGKAWRVVVEEGFADDDNVEVLIMSGELEEGDEVVVVGSRELEDGGPVRIDSGEGVDSGEAPPTEEATATADATADSGDDDGGAATSEDPGTPNAGEGTDDDTSAPSGD